MSNLYAGVDLGGTSFIAVVADRKGKVLGSSDCVTNAHAKAEQTIADIAEHVRIAARDAGVKTSKLKAVGVGAAGALRPQSGLVVRAPKLRWGDGPPARNLRQANDQQPPP